MTIDAIRRLEAEQRRLLEELRRSTAALEQSEVRRAQARQAADALTDASRELSGTLSVGDALARTLSAVQRLFGVRHALMYRLDEVTRTLTVVAQSHGLGAEEWTGHVLPPGVGVSGFAIAEGRAVWSGDVLADARIVQSPQWRDRLRVNGCTAVMAVPLCVKTGVWGTLVVLDNPGRAFGEDDARLLSAFADQVALALDNARLHEETETRLRQMETLVLVGRAVTSTLDVTEVMRRLAREAGRALRADVVGAYLADAGGETLRPVAGYRVPKDRLVETSTFVLAVSEHPFLQEAFATQRPVGAFTGSRGSRSPRVTWAGLAFGSLLFVPMVVHDRRIGGFFLGWWQEERQLLPDDVRLVEGIAGQAAVAADHARLYEETEGRRRAAEELARTGRVLTATLDISEVGQRIVDSVLDLFGAHSSIVRLLQPDGGLRLLAAAGVSADKIGAGHVAPAGQGIVGRAALEGRPVWAAETLGPERGVLSDGFRDVLARVGHRAVLAVPLRLKDRTIGVLAVAHQQVRAFSEGDVAALEAYADQAVLALENARLYAETEQRRREAEALAEVGRVLSEGLDPEVVARLITERACDLLGAQSAALYVLDAHSGALVTLRAWTNVAVTFQWTPVLPAGTGLGSVALRLRQPQASADVTADPRIEYTPEVRADNERKSHRALLAVPLFVGDRAVGVLAVGDVTGRVFTEDDIRLAQRFGDNAVLALDNARLHEETDQRRREAEVIAGLAATLNASLDVDATLQAVAAAARELCGSDAARIALTDPGTDAMVFRYLDGDDPVLFSGVRIGAGDGAGGHVIVTGEPFRTDDYLSDTRITHPFDDVVRVQRARAQVVVPIASGGRLEGLLYVVNRRPVPFTDRDEAVLVRVADHAAIAIRNAQSFEREHAARAAAEALADLSRLVSEIVDPAAIAARVTSSLRVLIEASNTVLYLIDGDSGDLRALGASDDDEATLKWPQDVRRGHGAVALALRERRTVTAVDVLRDPRLHFPPDARARLAASEFRSALVVPMVVQDRPLGVLAVRGRVGRVFEPKHVRLVEAFAGQAALAMENERLFAETQARRREAELIADLARTINASLDLDTVLQRITEGARDLCGADAARISLRVPDTDTLATRHAVGYRGPEAEALVVQAGIGVAGKALATGQVCRSADYANDPDLVQPHLEVARAEGLVTCMAAPIVIDGRVEGILHVDARAALRLRAGHEAVLQRLADHAAITLRNIRSFEREQTARTEAQTTAAALGESEEKMRVIVETALDAVVTMDGTGAITGWNAQAEAVFGWPRVEMLGRRLSDFVDTGGGPVVNRRVETLARRRDGVEIPVELAVATARMGDAVTFSAFIRDITDRRRAERREAVQFAVTRWLAESPTLSDAMPGLLRTIADGLGWALGQSWLIDRAAGVMRWESAWCSTGPGLGELESGSRHTTFERGQGVVGRVWESGGPVWLDDIAGDPAFRLLGEAQAAGLKAMVAFPIRSGSIMSGVMTFFARQSRPPDDELMETLADIGGQIGQFAERRRAEDEAAGRGRQQSAVAELSRVALTSADLDEVMTQAVRLLARTLDAPLCRILELSADGRRLLLRAGTGIRDGIKDYAVSTGERTQSGYTLVCKEPVIVNDVAAESRFTPGAMFQEYGVVSGMTVTIEGHERPFGVLGAHTMTLRRFTPDDAHFLQAMAGVLGAAFERRRAETIIRESEQRYRLLADNISDVIWVRNLRLRVTYVSPSATRLFGFTPEEMMGQELHDLLTPESLQRAGESIATLTEQPAGEPARSLTLELQARRKDGSTVWTETSVSILRDADGSPSSLLGVARDISARQRAEDALRRSEEHLRQAQKMEAIGRLAGGVAHDFNNIMTVIEGRSELMLGKLPAEAPVRRDVEILRGAARRATGLTRQLLAFSRKQVLQPRVLDLNAVLASMMDLLRRLIGEDVDLLTVPGAGLHRVRADPGQLEQVMMNLAVNARDAMPAGGRLTIATSNVVLGDPEPTDAPGAQAGPHVMLSVADTGTGMDAATQARVFDPFFTTKGPGKGTGLGLSTVYGIVTQSGGRVAVTSVPGAGSTFTVWLPAMHAPADVAVAAGVGGATRGTETILLVEDEEGVRELAQELLESLGYVVVTAANGHEALRICARPALHIDLMLTDVIMPQMSGKEAALRACALRADLKVLFMSGYTDDILGRHGVVDGGATLLEKPFTRESLAAKVREALDRA